MRARQNRILSCKSLCVTFCLRGVEPCNGFIEGQVLLRVTEMLDSKGSNYWVDFVTMPSPDGASIQLRTFDTRAVNVLTCESHSERSRTLRLPFPFGGRNVLMISSSGKWEFDWACSMSFRAH